MSRNVSKFFEAHGAALWMRTISCHRGTAKRIDVAAYAAQPEMLHEMSVGEVSHRLDAPYRETKEQPLPMVKRLPSNPGLRKPRTRKAHFFRSTTRRPVT